MARTHLAHPHRSHPAFTLLESLAAVILISLSSTLLLGSLLRPRATASAASTLHALVWIDHHARQLARTSGPVRVELSETRVVAMATDSGRVLLEHPLDADTHVVLRIRGAPHDQYLIDATGRSPDLAVFASRSGTSSAVTISGLTGWSSARISDRSGNGGAE